VTSAPTPGAATGRAVTTPDPERAESTAHPTSVTIYTDGACKGNPGPGGWGVVLLAGRHRRELSGAEPATTNNRMELRAAIEGLRQLNRRCRVTMVTDSEYVKNGITSWIVGWQRNGWLTK
jgi:ribonuclease HI